MTLENPPTDKQITKAQDRVHQLAVGVYEDYSFEGAWPHCYHISSEISCAVQEADWLTVRNRDIPYFTPTVGYGHYVLRLMSPTVTLPDSTESVVLPETLVIDGSYKQFARETDTPFAMGSINNIQSVVVQPQPQYIFARELADGIRYS